MELVVYDVFCMIFLDRPGAYYRLDQRARSERGAVTAEFVTTQMRAYHRLLRGAQSGAAAGALTNLELKDWWLMPKHVRSSLAALRASSPRCAPVNYDYVRFLRSFLPQQRDVDGEFRFFKSLAHYVPLLLSPDLELRRSPALSSSAYAYGVFARQRLRCGEYKHPHPALRGEVVRITDDEHAALIAAKKDFSVLVLDEEGASHLRVPGGVKGKWQRVKRGGQAGVVAGGISFLNHACDLHANMWPAVWNREADVGDGQWQVATAKRDIKTGEELFLFYAKFDPVEEEKDLWPCTRCACK
jgi:hypothetical protein